MEKRYYFASGDKDPIKAPVGRRYYPVPTDSTEPRDDVTGLPLTVRERFERECG